VKILVTGALGFVGKWLALELLRRGHHVIGGVGPSTDLGAIPAPWRGQLGDVEWISCELLNGESVEAALSLRPQAVVHLAAVASGAVARANPMAAWMVNCMGTADLVYAAERLRLEFRLVVASTGEVYGPRLRQPAHETDNVEPCSPYAASKLAAELACLEYQRRCGADVVLARPFAQTGPGQDSRFVVPALTGRILEAAEAGSGSIRVGNLDPVREFIDVRDVASALATLVENGTSGEVYNIARGQGTSLRELVRMIAAELGWEGQPVPDPALFRAADIPYLVGDGTRIAALGWTPQYELRSTLQDLIGSLR
jgi:GDP-4-dehydro-6-deoxy-D-mannose reductase